MGKECAYCGKGFESQRKSRLYCSDNCKQLAYYKRHGLMLSGSKMQGGSLAGADIVKDVKVSTVVSQSFIARLNALIEDEVEARLAQRVNYYKDTVKHPTTVQPYFTENDTSDTESIDTSDNKEDIEYTNDLDVKDDLDLTAIESNDDRSEGLNVKDESEASFTGTDSEKDEDSELDSEDPFAKAYAALDNFTISGNDGENDHQPSASIDSMLGDDPEPFSVKDSNTVKDEKETSFTAKANSHAGKYSGINNSKSQPLYDTRRTEPFNVKNDSSVTGRLKPSVKVRDTKRIYTHSEPLTSDIDSNVPFNVKRSENINDTFTVKHRRTAFPLNRKNEDVINNVMMNDDKRKGVLRNDNLDYTEAAQPFKWVYSRFTALINQYNRRTSQEILRYKNDSGPAKVLQIAKCLLRHLMVLSSRKQVSYELLVELSNNFYHLVNSEEFDFLTKDFPYRHQIVDLQRKIKKSAKAAKGNSVQLRLLIAQKAEIFAMLLEMKDTVKDVKLSEIKFQVA